MCTKMQEQIPVCILECHVTPGPSPGPSQGLRTLVAAVRGEREGLPRSASGTRVHGVRGPPAVSAPAPRACMGGCISAMPSRRSRSLSAALVEGADEELSPSLTLPAPVGVPRHRGGGASSPPRDALFSPSGDGRRESSSHRRRSSAASSGPGRPGPVVPSVGSAGWLLLQFAGCICLTDVCVLACLCRLCRRRPFGGTGNDDDHAFAAKYELAVRIGTGASAECWECVNNTTGEHYAVKIMSRRKVTLRGGDFDKYDSAPPRVRVPVVVA